MDAYRSGWVIGFIAGFVIARLNPTILPQIKE